MAIWARGGRKGRVAQTEIRVERVELRPPGTSRGAAPIPVWAVEVRETQPPADCTPLHWLLLASETDGAATAEAAQRLVRQYEWRWGLEECFRLLKTGAGLQDRQWQDAASLGKALAFDALETYRVFSLQRLARGARTRWRPRCWKRTRRPACTPSWPSSGSCRPRNGTAHRPGTSAA